MTRPLRGCELLNGLKQPPRTGSCICTAKSVWEIGTSAALKGVSEPLTLLWKDQIQIATAA
jgi:hypothetical protein